MLIVTSRKRSFFSIFISHLIFFFIFIIMSIEHNKRGCAKVTATWSTEDVLIASKSAPFKCQHLHICDNITFSIERKKNFNDTEINSWTGLFPQFRAWLKRLLRVLFRFVVWSKIVFSPKFIATRFIFARTK